PMLLLLEEARSPDQTSTLEVLAVSSLPPVHDLTEKESAKGRNQSMTTRRANLVSIGALRLRTRVHGRSPSGPLGVSSKQTGAMRVMVRPQTEADETKYQRVSHCDKHHCTHKISQK